MSTLECPQCGSTDVININLTMDESEQVSFYSCHRCDNRWWHKDGRSIELSKVLDMAKRPGRAAKSRGPADGAG